MLEEISSTLGFNDKAEKYKREATDMLALLEGYWSEEYGVYCDYGIQTPADEDLEEVRSAGIGTVKLKMGLECHVGYVTMFPLFLQLVPATSPKLGRMLDALADPKQLWSPYGIRSLSASDPYFGQGENYWRGAIWINCNFLALKVCYVSYCCD